MWMCLLTLCLSILPTLLKKAMIVPLPLCSDVCERRWMNKTLDDEGFLAFAADNEGL
ncbi:hypothetical protein HanXRQr2_Chr16g0728861 [Helianthus annuus]|uniref:Uncharacterized protein n=1 Tax=Helianthus annuus TaxID=4232 RepID=A0A9K3DMP9_HELAN|nr:hypothetical protein HanXRQr2_Chr16g0728861 [Helianthus annuus]KAJ0819667.1 hypothetical protein HanPSC8_Chr16g0698711 [Helianthus annuus]